MSKTQSWVQVGFSAQIEQLVRISNFKSSHKSMHHCKVKSHGIWESNSSQKLNGITTTLVDLRILFNNFPEIRKITGHRKAKTSTFRHMRTSILVDENEDNFSFLMYICTCMSEVSGIFGMCMAFCVHPMCSNYETLLTDYS